MTFDDKQQLEGSASNVSKNGIFRTVFSGGRVEIGAPVDPIEFNQRKTNIKFSLLKKLLLMVIICVLALTVLLIIKQITVKDTPEPNISAVQSTGHNLSSTAGQLSSNSEEGVKERVNERVTQRLTTTSTTTPITTERTTISSTEGTTTTTTTAPKVLDHILASIVINNATVPNKDGYVSLTDTYVKAFVDNNYIGTTPVAKETLSPEWDYQIAHQMTLRPDSVIKFMLYDNDKYSSHEFLGQVEVTTSELIANGSNGQHIHRHHGSGDIWFTITWEDVYRNY